VCLKNHSGQLNVPICGIFAPNTVAVARYACHIFRFSLSVEYICVFALLAANRTKNMAEMPESFLFH
jgi:hypothetical protein